MYFQGRKIIKKGVTSFMFAFDFYIFLLNVVFKNLGINIFEHDTIVVHIVNKKGIFSQKIARENK